MCICVVRNTTLYDQSLCTKVETLNPNLRPRRENSYICTSYNKLQNLNSWGSKHFDHIVLMDGVVSTLLIYSTLILSESCHGLFVFSELLTFDYYSNWDKEPSTGFYTERKDRKITLNKRSATFLKKREIKKITPTYPTSRTTPRRKEKNYKTHDDGRYGDGPTQWHPFS